MQSHGLHVVQIVDWTHGPRLISIIVEHTDGRLKCMGYDSIGGVAAVVPPCEPDPDVCGPKVLDLRECEVRCRGPCLESPWDGAHHVDPGLGIEGIGEVVLWGRPFGIPIEESEVGDSVEITQAVAGPSLAGQNTRGAVDDVRHASPRHRHRSHCLEI